jgi:hypothetical protein
MKMRFRDFGMYQRILDVADHVGGTLSFVGVGPGIFEFPTDDDK